MADETTKIIRELTKIMDVEDLMREVKLIQDEAYQRAVDYYAEQSAKNQGSDLIGRAGRSAKAATLFERDLFEYIAKNRGYNKQVRGYLRNFDTIDTLNKNLHEVTNGIKINKVLEVAQETKGIIKLEMGKKGIPVVKTANGVVGRIYQNLTGDELRNNFTRGVRKVMYDNLLMGTPFSEARKNLSLFIQGDADRLGQLERWSGQITRDALSQYDGFINGLVAEQYDMNAYKYLGSIITTTRKQCARWVSKRTLKIEDLQAEIDWAKANGSGMIPGTNVKNFATYRGGYNCRHKAIATFIEDASNKVQE